MTSYIPVPAFGGSIDRWGNEGGPTCSPEMLSHDDLPSELKRYGNHPGTADRFRLGWLSLFQLKGRDRRGKAAGPLGLSQGRHSRLWRDAPRTS